MNKCTGLVLMGGQSSRMGTDKSMLKMGDNFLYQIAAGKLQSFCHEIYLSVNRSQAIHYDLEWPIIIDKYQNEGPVSGILSCYEAGHSSMLVLAIDLIKITNEDISSLLSLHELNGDICTMFYNDKDGYFEPLLSFWTELALSNLKIFFLNGGRSLQIFLKDQNIRRYNAGSLNNFLNINTKEDFKDFC